MFQVREHVLKEWPVERDLRGAAAELERAEARVRRSASVPPCRHRPSGSAAEAGRAEAPRRVEQRAAHVVHADPRVRRSSSPLITRARPTCARARVHARVRQGGGARARARARASDARRPRDRAEPRAAQKRARPVVGQVAAHRLHDARASPSGRLRRCPRSRRAGRARWGTEPTAKAESLKSATARAPMGCERRERRRRAGGLLGKRRDAGLHAIGPALRARPRSGSGGFAEHALPFARHSSYVSETALEWDPPRAARVDQQAELGHPNKSPPP